MRLRVTCSDCLRERINRGEVYAEEASSDLTGEIQNDGIVRAHCPVEGHGDQVTVIQAPTFEIVFELAALALLDEHYREAVMSFSTALERVFEFYIRVVLRRRNLAVQLAKAWRPDLKLSERQLGAFLLCHLIESEHAFDYNGKVERFKKLRNDTTHDGYIPSRAETLEYGDAVLRIIHELLSSILSTPDAAMVEEIGYSVGERRQRNRITHASTFAYFTVVRVASPSSWGTYTLDAALRELQDHRPWLYPTEIERPQTSSKETT